MPGDTVVGRPDAQGVLSGCGGIVSDARWLQLNEIEGRSCADTDQHTIHIYAVERALDHDV